MLTETGVIVEYGAIKRDRCTVVIGPKIQEYVIFHPRFGIAVLLRVTRRQPFQQRLRQITKSDMSQVARS